MDDGWVASLAFAWRPENDGQGIHRVGGDKGGWTSWGVTQAIFDAWMAQHRLVGTLAQAARWTLSPILYAWFWLPCGDGLPAGVNVMVFDFCMTSGQGSAAKMLQRLVGATIDGNVGARTKAAAAAMDATVLCQALHAAQVEFYNQIPGHELDAGWFRRADDRLTEALRLIAIAGSGLGGTPAPG